MQDRITTKIELDTDKNEVNRSIFNSQAVDSGGKVLDETEYNPDGSVACKRIYRYFDDGEVSEYIQYDALDQLLERHIHTQNSDGEVDRIDYEYMDGRRSTKEFYFSDVGNSDRAVVRDENGEVISQEVYVFDDEGRLIEEMELDGDSKEVTNYVKSYGDNGLLITTKQYTDGALYAVTTLEYDDNGNVIQETKQYPADAITSIDNFRYDDKGNMVYNSSHRNGLLIFENRCQYNAKQELVTEEFFELDPWSRKILRHERLIHESQE